VTSSLGESGRLVVRRSILDRYDNSTKHPVGCTYVFLAGTEDVLFGKGEVLSTQSRRSNPGQQAGEIVLQR
jgi:hypothetical protein